MYVPVTAKREARDGLRDRLGWKVRAGRLPLVLGGAVVVPLLTGAWGGHWGAPDQPNPAVMAVKPADPVASAAAAPLKPVPQADTMILDRGEFPGIDTCLAAAHEAHASGWMVYMGGPSLYFSPWPQDSAAQLIQKGVGVLPVYAAGSPGTDSGADQGSDAARLAAAYHIPAGSPVLLDIEPAIFRADPEASVNYVRDWNHSVRAGGYKPSTYSTADSLSAVASMGPEVSTSAIVAAYPQPGQFWGPPSTADAPLGGLWVEARGWQFTDEVVFGGVNVDATSLNFPIATSVAKGR